MLVAIFDANFESILCLKVTELFVLGKAIAKHRFVKSETIKVDLNGAPRFCCKSRRGFDCPPRQSMLILGVNSFRQNPEDLLSLPVPTVFLGRDISERLGGERGRSKDLS